MVHEIAVNCGNGDQVYPSGLGLPKTGPWVERHCRWFGEEELCPVREIGSSNRVMGSRHRAVLALLLPVVAERGWCDPTSTVQAGGCGGETEIAERSRTPGGALETDAPCAVYK